MLGAFATAEYVRHRRTVLANLAVMATQSGEVVEANLRHAMLDSDFTEVQSLLDTLGQRGEFAIVYLLDPAGRVIFAPGSKNIGLQLVNTSPDCQPCHQLPASARPGSVVVNPTGEQRVFRSMQPIENSAECSGCHGTSQRTLGLLLTDISMAPMEGALAADLRENLLWGALTILTSVLVVNVVLSRFVLNRLERFSGAISGLGGGSIPPPIEVGAPDEIGALVATFNTMAAQVQSRERENAELSEGLRRQSALRGELLKRIITAQEDERRRVARELHDELGQTLSGLGYQAQAIEQLIVKQPQRAQEQSRQIHAAARDALNDMYDLIFELRPSALDDLGLVAALRACAERVLRNSDVHFELRTVGLSERLPPALETALYRIFQEALTNTVKHAGASRVRISLACHGGYFVGKIVDNGAGFDPLTVEAHNGRGPTARGLGLLGMRERIAQCAGELDIASRPGWGTRIRIRVPLEGNDG